METITLTRKELFDMVWTTPLLVLAKKYEISDNGLRKMCKRLDIPLPPMGHWQKIAHRKKTRPGKFIERNPDREKIHLKLRNPDQEKVRPFKASADTFPGLNFQVSEKLIVPDKLVVTSEKILKSSAAEQQKRNPGHLSLINCAQGLSIYVSPLLFDRALCFMDALIKLVRQRGHLVTLDHGSCVMIGEQKIKIALREKTTRIKIDTKNTWNSTQDIPNGQLVFKCEGFNSKEWSDKKETIEQQLPAILHKLEEAAEQMRLEDIEREERRVDNELRKKLRREHEALEDKELEQVRDLMSQAMRWHRMNMLRTFIHDMEMIERAGSSSNPKSEEWIKWAKQKADWFDPSVNRHDDLLKEVNKNTLTMRRQESGYYYSYQETQLKEEKNFWSRHWWNK